MIKINNWDRFETPASLKKENPVSLAFPTTALPVQELRLLNLGVQGLALKGFCEALRDSMSRLGLNARKAGIFLDSQGEPYDLPAVQTLAGLNGMEDDVVQDLFESANELGLIEVTGNDALDLGRVSSEEERTEQMGQIFGDLVSRLKDALPPESTKGLSDKLIYKALANLPEEQIPKEMDLIKAAKSYSKSTLFLKELSKDKPKIIRAHKFIEDRKWREFFRPAFSDTDFETIREFYAAYPEAGNGVTINKVLVAFVKLNSLWEKESLLSGLKAWGSSPAWELGNITPILKFIENKSWKNPPREKREEVIVGDATDSSNTPEFPPSHPFENNEPEISDNDLGVPSESHFSASGVGREADLSDLPEQLQLLFREAPDYCLQSSAKDEALAAWERLGPGHQPSLAQIQTLLVKLRQSYLWTLHRCYPNYPVTIPTIARILEDEKWNKEIRPAFPTEDMEVLRHHHGGMGFLDDQLDHAFKIASKGCQLTRIRDGGKLEVLNLELSLPPEYDGISPPLKVAQTYSPAAAC